MVSEHTASSVGDIPVCPGCGLAGELRYGDICDECWKRRERRAGGGPLRVITEHGDHYHETNLCPAVRGANWMYVRDEDMCYDDLAGRIDKCKRCHRASVYGFDYYRGDTETPIGHA